MDPSIAAALATISSAIATAILMFAAYHWPSGHTEFRDKENYQSRRRKKKDPEDDSD